MNTTRFTPALLGTFLALTATIAPVLSRIANAQSPSHIYELNGDYTDSLGGPALNGGISSITATGASFAPNSLLSLSGGFASTGTYSIEMYFQLNTVDSYRKLLDFKNRASDTGLYARNNALEFYGGAGSAPNLLPANTMTHLVFTRDDATQQVKGYLNGNAIPALSFADVNNYATLTGTNNILYFFTDDITSSESSGGFVDYIRTYDVAISGQEASNVYTQNVLNSVTVPESSTLVLVGGVSLFAVVTLFRRRSLFG